MDHIRTLVIAMALVAVGCSDDVDSGASASTADSGADSGAGADVADGAAGVDTEDGGAVSQPTCEGQPVDSPFEVETTAGNIAIHWPITDGCIEVTYDPELAPEVAELTEGFDVWNAIECSQLCFQLPRNLGVAATDTSSLGGFHITTNGALVGHDDLGGSSSFTWSLRDSSSGQLQTVVIVVEPAGRVRQLEQVVVGAIARGVGIDFSSEGEVINTLPLSLEVDVEAAVCAVYGDPPHCPD